MHIIIYKKLKNEVVNVRQVQPIMNALNNSVNVHTSVDALDAPQLFTQVSSTSVDLPTSASPFGLLAMPPGPPKLVQHCTSWNCVCPEGPDNCQWYAENQAGMAIGDLRVRQATLLDQKADVDASIIAVTNRLSEGMRELDAKSVESDAKPTECDAKPVESDAKPVESDAKQVECDIDALKAKIVESQTQLKQLHEKVDIIVRDLDNYEVKINRIYNLRAKKLPLDILPGDDPRDRVAFLWPKESVDLFEEVITWTGPNWLCYTPNSRYESYGILELGAEPGSWTEFYSKNGCVRYYFYRSLAGTVWVIGFFNGVFNSVYAYTR
jgi:hypothetical protein